MPTTKPAQATKDITPHTPAPAAEHANVPDEPQSAALLRRGREAPRSLAREDVLQLQRSLGNQSVIQLLRDAGPSSRPVSGGARTPAVQRHLTGVLEEVEESSKEHTTTVTTELSQGSPQGGDSSPETTPVSTPSPETSSVSSSPPESTSVSTPSPETSSVSSSPPESTSVSTVSEPPKPISVPKTQETLRGEVNTFDPTSGDIIKYISDRITDAKQIPGLITVVPRDGLVDALALDMAARANQARTSEHDRAAEREVANGGGGFTALDGKIYVLDTAENSSALFHEVIHVLSGPGGATPLSALKMQLNEGFTNYFAEEVAGFTGGAVFAAYPFPTKWARKFAATHGRDVAYDIYFKGNLTKLYETMGKFYLEKVKANVGGKFKQFEINGVKDKGAWSEAKAIAVVTNKVRTADFFDEGAMPNQWFEDRVF